MIAQAKTEMRAAFIQSFLNGTSASDSNLFQRAALRLIRNGWSKEQVIEVMDSVMVELSPPTTT